MTCTVFSSTCVPVICIIYVMTYTVFSSTCQCTCTCYVMTYTVFSSTCQCTCTCYMYYICNDIYSVFKYMSMYMYPLYVLYM